MSTDVSVSLAAAAEGRWGLAQSVALVSSIVPAIEGASSDWDEGAGESWARVLVNDQVVAFIWMAGPLVILDASRAGLETELKAAHAQVVLVSNLASDELFADKPSVEGLAQRPLSEAFDPACFSAEDLVWATM